MYPGSILIVGKVKVWLIFLLPLEASYFLSVFERWRMMEKISR
jgi:hypothetical protein